MANGQGLCPAAPSALDLREPCVRGAWATLVPAALVALYLLFSLPLPVPALVKKIVSPFKTYMTLPEAEAVLAGASPAEAQQARHTVVGRPRLWRSVLASTLALVLALGWTIHGAFRAGLAGPEMHAWRLAQPFVVAGTWAYAAAVPALAPRPTPAYSLFALYLAHAAASALTFGGALLDAYLGGTRLPVSTVVLNALNIAAIGALLLGALSTPIAVPSAAVDADQVGKAVSPEDYTTLWGWISFGWVSPLVAAGTATTLHEADVWALSPTLQSRAIFAKFAALPARTLVRRIWAANSLDFVLDFSLTLVSIVFAYAGPFFLKQILDAIANPTPAGRARAYVFALLTLACSAAKAEADVQHLWFARRAGARTRSELMAAIYDKALKRKDFSGIVGEKDKDKKGDMKKPKKEEDQAGADVGKIVNLMSGDANRVAQIITGMYFIYGAPLELAIAMTFLYRLLGVSAFAGLLVLVAGWPLNSAVTRRSIAIQRGVLAARDARMGVLGELLGAVKFIKFFAWEDRWIRRALDSREEEMRWMVKARMNSVLFTALWTLAPVLVALVSFTAFVRGGHELDVATAFTALALFAMVRQPLNVIPTYVVQILQTRVALARIAGFLAEDEVDARVSSLKPRDGDVDVQEEGLGFEGASFCWNEVVEKKEDGKKKGKRAPSEESVETQEEAPSRFELRDLTLRIPEGKLTVITGPTASGKTALLMALLGEMTPLGGRLLMSKAPGPDGTAALSYAAQAPWLRHQSIRENILFGAPFDEQRYAAVVDACALAPDLKVLEDGDATEIGARGVSLSGGQKARVALARAVYARTRVVLLDDPLSAVDAHTARALVERLLGGPLLVGRTVVLVTHHVALAAPAAHFLVRMLDGRVDAQGSVAELRAAGVLAGIESGEAVEVAVQDRLAEEVHEAEVAVAEGGVPEVEAQEARKAPRKLVETEKREEGSVKWAIYNTYLRASSYWTWALLALLIVFGQGLSVSEKFWIRVWGQAYGEPAPAPYTYTSFATPEHELALGAPLHLGPSAHAPALASISLPALPNANEHPMFYVGVYAAIGLGTAAVTVLSAVTQYTGALRASRRLFKQLLVGVVRASFRWHDTTPLGRMLNRFSKDIETVDSSLASSLQAVNTSLASFFASVLTVAVIFPPFVLYAVCIGALYYRLALGYLNTGRDLRRMESNSRSPIFSGFAELLEGIVTVRAFAAERRFLDDLHAKIDLTTQMWYGFWMMNRWLLLRFDVVGAFTVFVTTLFALSGVVDAGLAGVCITSAMAFTSGVYWACRFWTGLELDLNSVERVVEYLDLPQEPPAVIEGSRPPAYWPSSSSTTDALIRVENLTVRYAPELPPVLHGVSLELRARERIGLLGRTGSGKSTLAMSVLRFVDPAEGRIVIDGIDISKIGVHDLRSRLTFIPQDATLFSGTLRENLDPFNEHSDADCLDALHRVHMLGDSSARPSRATSRAPSIKAPSTQEDDATAPPSPAGSSSGSATLADDARPALTLDAPVSAAGANFSQGQRQLLALARALLRRAPVIVLDEATSSIDFATDAKIQAAIRAEFGDSLLLTVAHRLRTVIDYDRLIVLDKGTVAEFDTPLTLIRKEGGIFRQMCLQSGSFAELEAAAQAKADADAEVNK